MRLTLDTLEANGFAGTDIEVPRFDVRAMRDEARRQPRWAHFGPGNIFRVYIARLAQDLMNLGEPQCGISAIVPLLPAELDVQLAAFDLLTLGVTLHADGETDLAVIGSICEGLAYRRADDFARATELFTTPSLQIVSFTITEKGYQLRTLDGSFQEPVRHDLEKDPTEPMSHTMAMLTGLLYQRYAAGGEPLALLSCDNFSRNGDKLKDSVTTIARQWHLRGTVKIDFLTWLNDETRVSFPISVIDKITPRPAQAVSHRLQALGLDDMALTTDVGPTPLAGFVNTEPAEYLVIEDSFPNGRPRLEKVRVHFTDRRTCDRFEHMKVTACLNPLHTALAITGVLLRKPTIDAEMHDPGLAGLVHRLGWDEGMPVVVDPGVVSPNDFLREVEEERFPNAFLGDTPQRIATDTSQKIPIRFGETIKAYLATDPHGLDHLVAIPFVFSAWCRYLMGVGDDGEPIELSPDPLLTELRSVLSCVSLGEIATARGALRPILSRPEIFGIDLYTTPLAAKVEEFFAQMIVGPHAVRSLLDKEFAQ